MSFTTPNKRPSSEMPPAPKKRPSPSLFDGREQVFEDIVKNWFIDRFGVGNGVTLYTVLDEMKHLDVDVVQKYLPYAFGGTVVSDAPEAEEPAASGSQLPPVDETQEPVDADVADADSQATIVQDSQAAHSQAADSQAAHSQAADSQAADSQAADSQATISLETQAADSDPEGDQMLPSTQPRPSCFDLNGGNQEAHKGCCYPLTDTEESQESCGVHSYIDASQESIPSTPPLL